MKKLLVLCILLLFVLTGCTDNDSTDDLSDSDLKKAQAIVLCDANGTPLQTISDDKAIDAFITSLDIDHWELAELPAQTQAIGSIGFSQEKTIHFGETDNDGNLYDIALLTIYDTPIADIELLGFHLTFSLPDTTYETLTSYLQ